MVYEENQEGKSPKEQMLGENSKDKRQRKGFCKARLRIRIKPRETLILNYKLHLCFSIKTDLKSQPRITGSSYAGHHYPVQSLSPIIPLDINFLKVLHPFPPPGLWACCSFCLRFLSPLLTLPWLTQADSGVLSLHSTNLCVYYSTSHRILQFLGFASFTRDHDLWKTIS